MDLLCCCRRMLPLFAWVGLVSSAACEVTLVVPADSEVTVPGSQILGPNPLAPEQILPRDFGVALSQQLAQSFSTEGVETDAIRSAKVTRLTVTVLDPEENGRQVRDLGFLNQMAFSLGAADLVPAPIASSEDGAFASAPTFYEFLVTNEELVSFLQADDELTITGEVETNSAPNFATTLRFDVEMTVVADVIGALN